MHRPVIKPALFIGLQNAMAALLFSGVLTAELVRRLLYHYPGSEELWRLSALSNRSVLPVLRFMEDLLPGPDRLLLGLVGCVVVPLLAWRTRYWLATAVAGHVTFAALMVMAYSAFVRSRSGLALAALSGDIPLRQPDPAALIFLALAVMMLVMCIADHVAFIRFILSFRRRR